MKKKITVSVIFVFIIILLVTSVTYAIYTWADEEVIEGSADCFNVNYIKGQDIGSENEHKVLMPTIDYKGGLYASVMVGMDSNCISNGVGTLYLNTDETTSDALLGVLKYQVIENSLNLVQSGTIEEKGQIAILEDFKIAASYQQYTVVVWLDGSMIDAENKEQILSSTYKGHISMKVESGDL